MSQNEITILLSIIAVLISIFNFILKPLRGGVNVLERISELEINVNQLSEKIIAINTRLDKHSESFIELLERMTVMETKMDLFWKIVENKMPSMLRMPTHLEMDLLLDKMTAGKLNYSEMNDLKMRLNDIVYNNEKDVMKIFVLARLEQLLTNANVSV